MNSFSSNPSCLGTGLGKKLFTLMEKGGIFKGCSSLGDLLPDIKTPVYLVVIIGFQFINKT